MGQICQEHIRIIKQLLFYTTELFFFFISRIDEDPELPEEAEALYNLMDQDSYSAEEKVISEEDVEITTGVISAADSSQDGGQSLNFLQIYSFFRKSE